jgi:diguanylate cyclase
VLVVGVAIEAVSLWPRTYFTLFAAPIAMGSGIVAMHYTGMWALHASTHMTHNPVMVATSILISIVASAMALWLTFDDARRPSLFISAMLLGLAISGMHYTAMAGTTLLPLANPLPPNSPVVSPGLLAIVVAVVAFALSGVFLLTFVPEQSNQTSKPSEVLTPPNAFTIVTKAAESGEIGGEPEADPLAPLFTSPPSPLPSLATKALPIEREGIKASIKVEQIFAVRADAHYTFVFDGLNDFFSPLAIGEVEELLADGSFLRVHRSHLVNLDRVKCVRRAGDNAIAELTGLPKAIPVSRSKFNELRALLQERTYVGPK